MSYCVVEEKQCHNKLYYRKASLHCLLREKEEHDGFKSCLDKGKGNRDKSHNNVRNMEAKIVKVELVMCDMRDWFNEFEKGMAELDENLGRQVKELQWDMLSVINHVGKLNIKKVSHSKPNC